MLQSIYSSLRPPSVFGRRRLTVKKKKKKCEVKKKKCEQTPGPNRLKAQQSTQNGA
jgi:hypothetical protein